MKGKHSLGRTGSALVLAAVILFIGGVAIAEEDAGKTEFLGKGLIFESPNGKFSVNVGSRVQFRLTMEDPDEGDTKASFRVRRAKFSLKGNVYEHWKYKIQAVWSGGSTTLEDAYFQYTKNKAAQFWLGQGKVFFGRQELTSSGSQQFVDRSIASERFAPGRDQGVALIGKDKSGRLEYNVGVYNGNGRNKSADDNEDFLYTGRVVWTPLGSYNPAESALDYPDSSRFALGLSGLMTTNPEKTTTTQVLETDMGMFTGNIIDVTTVATPEADVTRYGAEFAYKIHGFNTTGEFFTESWEPIAGADLDTDGFWVQVAYLFPNKKYEVAGRYSTIRPDGAGDVDDIETGVGFSYYIQQHKYKFQADLREIEDEATGTEDHQIRAQFQWAF